MENPTEVTTEAGDGTVTAYVIDAGGVYQTEVTIPAERAANQPWLTTIAPPPHKPGFAGVFDRAAGEWAVVEDYRGLLVVDDSQAEPIFVDSPGALGKKQRLYSADR